MLTEEQAQVKYIKYKQKYLELKASLENEQVGGMGSALSTLKSYIISGASTVASGISAFTDVLTNPDFIAQLYGQDILDDIEKIPVFREKQAAQARLHELQAVVNRKLIEEGKVLPNIPTPSISPNTTTADQAYQNFINFMRTTKSTEPTFQSSLLSFLGQFITILTRDSTPEQFYKKVANDLPKNKQGDISGEDFAKLGTMKKYLNLP
jgi:hypothetical protein